MAEPTTKILKQKWGKLALNERRRIAARYEELLELNVHTPSQCWGQAFDPLGIIGTLYRDLFAPTDKLFVLLRLATDEEVEAENEAREDDLDILAAGKCVAAQEAYTIDRIVALGRVSNAEVLIRGSHELELV